MNAKRLLGFVLSAVLLCCVLSAHAQDATVTITLDGNASDVATSKVTLNAGAPLAAAAPKRFGYSFTGWYLNAEATQPIGEAYVAGTDATLYAGWEAWDAKTQEYMALYKEEIMQAKYIMNRYKAYEDTSFLAYYQAAFKAFLAVEMGGLILNDQTVGMVYGVAAAREALVQLVDPESICLYIWGDEMPNEDIIGFTSDFWYGYYDNPDFKPFLIANIQPDQSKVKGNIIFISGGGFTMRANMEEAYPNAEYFYEQGFNTYVLQRRVLPYERNDAGVDLQRAIRYLRYNAETLGIERLDNMAAAGYSGGSGTIMVMLSNFADDQSPDSVYPAYTPDAVDAESASLQAVLLVYGGGSVSFGDLLGVRESFPATFFAFGTDDSDSIVKGGTEMYLALRGVVDNLEIHGFSQTGHGFGLAKGIDGWMHNIAGTNAWADLAVTFLDVEFGNIERNTGSVENYPAW